MDPVATAAAIAKACHVTPSAAVSSRPMLALNTKDPIQIPGHLADPLASSAHKATPEAGQTIVA